MKRTLSYDCIRIIACIMVVLMHSKSADIGAHKINLSGIGYEIAPCIVLSSISCSIPLEYSLGALFYC